MTLHPTPLHARTAALNRLQAWGPWAGYATPLNYGDTAMEHSAIRNAASVYDISPMMKYAVQGPEAEDYLNRLTVRDVRKLTPGGVQYTAWCDDAGMLIDDGTLFRLGPDRFRLCCQERHLPWLLDSARGFDVTVTDESEPIAALSLQGPTSATVLRAAGIDVGALKPFRMATFGEVTVSRTGFTGDLGYELWVTRDAALALWDRLFAAGAPYGITPVGSQALDIARIEAGFVIAGIDFTPAPQAVREDRLRSPLAMGLDWLVAWDKGHFTGRRALLAERERGPEWAFLGLDLDGNIEAGGAILYHRGRTEAGVVTSACWSPTLKRSIALAQVRRRFAAADALQADIYALREGHYARRMTGARIVPRPFLTLDRRRATPPGRF